MKALSIRQPWAWLILHAGKTIENRTQDWTYRGPIAIYAPARIDTPALGEPMVRHAFRTADKHQNGRHEHRQQLPTSTIIGVADLTDTHHETGGCCTPWGEPGAVHLVLANPRPVRPIGCRGHLGLWTPPTPILDQLAAQTWPGGDASSVWSSAVPPGGFVCVICGIPVESKPCTDHQAMAYDTQAHP